MSLFYPDVVIGRPGARCDALEAQNMIVCIPGARRCYQRTGLVNLGYKILVRNLRDCAKMGLTLTASYSVPHTQLFTLSTSSVSPPISHFAPSTSHLERGPVATNDCSGKHAVSSGTQSSGPVASRALGPCK